MMKSVSLIFLLETVLDVRKVNVLVSSRCQIAKWERDFSEIGLLKIRLSRRMPR